MVDGGAYAFGQSRRIGWYPVGADRPWDTRRRLPARSTGFTTGIVLGSCRIVGCCGCDGRSVVASAARR